MKSLPYKKKFVITQTFLNPSNLYASGYHLGVDLVGLEDKKIVAIQDGIVDSAGYDRSFGNTVVVRQEDGLYARYSHLESVNVGQGQKVWGGQTMIGVEGKTGNVVGTGDLRHLDLRILDLPYHTNNKAHYRNPCDYLGFPNRKDYLVLPEEHNPNQQEEKNMTKIKNVILCGSEIDKRAASYLADYLQCKIIDPDLLPASVIDELFENIYVIGPSQKPVTRAVLIYGADRYETCLKVLNKIAELKKAK